MMIFTTELCNTNYFRIEKLSLMMPLGSFDWLIFVKDIDIFRFLVSWHIFYGHILNTKYHTHSQVDTNWFQPYVLINLIAEINFIFHSLICWHTHTHTRPVQMNPISRPIYISKWEIKTLWLCYLIFNMLRMIRSLIWS